MKIIYGPAKSAARSKDCCEWCKKPRCLEAAHIFACGAGGGTRIDADFNLLGLCAGQFGCHAAHHRGDHPTRDDMLAVAAYRDGVLQTEIKAKWDLIGRTPKEVFRGYRGRRLQEVVSLPLNLLTAWIEERTVIA